MLLAIAVLIAIPIGYLFKGALRNYIRAPLKLVLLPCAAFLLEACLSPLAQIVPIPVNRWLGWAVCLEYALLAVFLWTNRKDKGVPLLAAGAFANFAAISISGFRMPVSPIIHQLPGASAIAQQIADGNIIGYTLVDWNAPLWFLGDTIPFFRGLASIGDFLMAIALIVIIVNKMTAKPAE